MHDNNSSIRSNTQTKLGQDSEPYISFLDLTIPDKDSVSEEELSCFRSFWPWCENISSRKDSCCIAGDPAADSNHDGHIYPDAVMKARDSSHTLCEANASTSSVPTLRQSSNPNYVEPQSIPSAQSTVDDTQAHPKEISSLLYVNNTKTAIMRNDFDLEVTWTIIQPVPRFQLPQFNPAKFIKINAKERLNKLRGLIPFLFTRRTSHRADPGQMEDKAQHVSIELVRLDDSSSGTTRHMRPVTVTPSPSLRDGENNRHGLTTPSSDRNPFSTTTPNLPNCSFASGSDGNSK
ncbi:hypothetical protein PNOK_0014900 [Pyrrhoderma noxium]|uniref:Uncharacterized protein n=1 Tax=Pyrrhoderma noxium TaxID=2282107 RepID=A0A286UUA1_9AGAM|nr:hypothetical protein PNOK_0014900 [Pyrrhoderma noxium]